MASPGRACIAVLATLGALAAVSADRVSARQSRVSSERPFVLPSLLRLLGPMSGTVFLADLGRNQTYPHTPRRS